MSWHKIYDFFVPRSGDVTLREKLLAGLTAFVGMIAVAWISQRTVGQHGMLFMATSMGSAAVLLFASPSSPQAQPWALIGGHLCSAVIGVFCAQTIPLLTLAAALAVALSIMVMFFLRCLHPPGGAAALAAVMGGPQIHALGYQYVLVPVALNVLVILVMALIVNNILPGRRYPLMAGRNGETGGGKLDWAVGEALFRDEDLESAMSELETYVDADRSDLKRIYTNAMINAYKRRLGAVRCADIMNREPLSFPVDTPLETAWAQLTERNIRRAPVVDSDRYVRGIVTMTDLMKHAANHPVHSYGKRLYEVVASGQQEIETVASIMTAEVVVARDDLHIVDTIQLFNSKHLNLLPITDQQGRLVGVLTRADVMQSLMLVRR